MIISKLRQKLYNYSVKIMPFYYRFFYNIDLGEGVLISRKASLDKSINPQGVHIQAYTRITGGVDIIAHDACRRLKAPVNIGRNCFLGTKTIVLPGVTIGDEVVIGSGSVVTHDIPSNCIAAGNPAKVIRINVRCDKYGVIIDNGIRADNSK